MDAALSMLVAAIGKAALSVRPHVHGEWLGDLRFDREGEIWHVQQPPENPCRLWIPEIGFEYAWKGGFDSDGGSIPAVFQSIKELRLKPDSFLRSYFLHDFCYASAAVYTSERGASAWARMPVTRAMADCLLYVGLTAEAATLAEARAIYRAVRIGGAWAWKGHRKHDGEA